MWLQLVISNIIILIGTLQGSFRHLSAREPRIRRSVVSPHTGFSTDS